jgi:menaquinone-dependent protoporphyrinogen oxidase
MRVLIVYASKYGGVAQTALDLQQYINIPTDVRPVSDESIPLSDYDIVITGGSLHSGSIQNELKRFLKKNKDTLLNKKFAYFFCCLMPGEKAEKIILPKQMPEELMKHAFARSFPGADVNYTKMSIIERFILKKITRKDESFSRRDEEELKKFSEKINSI